MSRRDIDPDALRVLQRLDHAGFQAYLVGGGVRDLLLGRRPKDFDISTDAHPGQIRKLFSNAFLIGRRFRLAHIRFGNKVIETSTFRRKPDSDADPDDPDADLFHAQDNTFGTPQEDAVRRDFTINGLFYDIATFNVIDYVGGLDDIEKKLIRSIGSAPIRFREDSVRMLRAVRFASRLGFEIEDETYHAILSHHAEIAKAAPQRLLEEITRLFAYGAGEPAFRLLRRTMLLSILFPELEAYLDRHPEHENPLWQCLAALSVDKTLPAPPQPLVFAALAWPLFNDAIQDAGGGGRADQNAKFDIASDILTPMARRFQMPKRVFYDVVHMLCDQDQFELSTSPGAMRRFACRHTFPISLELYRLRTAHSDAGRTSMAAWLAIRDEATPRHRHPPAQSNPGDERNNAPPAKRRRRRPSRRKRPNHTGRS